MGLTAPEPGRDDEDRTVRAAAVQMDVRLGDVRGNARHIVDCLRAAAAQGAELVVFPECALQGYCFRSLEEGLQNAADAAVPEALGTIADAAGETGVCAVVGYLAGGNGHCWNSAAILNSGGRPADYRKTHLPTLGVDRFVTPGDRLPVYDTPVGRLGVLICYDVRFAEAARCLNLLGADILALPTNWPQGAESAPDFLTRARAWENRMYVIAANRVGTERGRRFIGRSQIVAPNGVILQEAPDDDEVILYADLDLREAREKRIIIEPGEWEMDITGDRRPELYGALGEASRNGPHA